MTEKLSFCRVCNNCCAVVVDVDDHGRALSVRGDRENPLFEGYTCVKGRAAADIHNDPSRLLHSMKRTPDGSYEPIESERAMDEIAAKLRVLLDEHGPRSIAGYFGTSVTANFWLTFPTGFGFFYAIQSPMRFGTETLDQPGKNIAKGCHGTWMAPSTGMVDPEVVMLFGLNPLVSHVGFPTGNPARWLSRQLDRGMQLIVIDPRRTEVARRATLHLQARPGHDTEIMAAIARVIIEEDLYDHDFVTENVSGLGELRRAVAPFTPTAVAERAGIDPDDLVRAARIYAGAGRAYAASGTGPSMAASSTLIEYLRSNIMTLCGHWQREGEILHNPGTTVSVSGKAQALPPFPSYGPGVGEPMRVRGLGATAAGVPTCALADEILLPGEGQVRALISYCGNPVVAWPDQLRTVDAMKALELLVVIDPRMNQTAQLADYVIAPKMSFETPGITYMGDVFPNLGPGWGLGRAYGQYSPAIAEPPARSDLIGEWEFFYGVAQRLGVTLGFLHWAGDKGGEPLTFDMENKPTVEELLEHHMASSRISLDELKQQPHGAFFPDDGILVGPRDEGWEGRLDLGNSDMLSDLTEWATQLDQPTAAADREYPFRLITRRMMHVYNSWARPPASRALPYNPAFMNAADLERLGLAVGDIAEIRSPYGAIVGVVGVDPNVREGVISMAQNFGGMPEEDDQVRSIGSPTGRLLNLEFDYERYSGQPRMSNIPVKVRQVDPAPATV